MIYEYTYWILIGNVREQNNKITQVNEELEIPWNDL